MNPDAAQTPHATGQAPRARSHEPVVLRLTTPGSQGRQDLERCIARQFHDQHDAHVENFLPRLLSIETPGQLNAVVGLRPAGDAPLFLEQYLDVPVEQAISRAFLTPVDRNDIIEIGNLAAQVPGETYALFAVLARVLALSGYRWVVCTATLHVEAMLDNMRFPSQAICTADPVRLGERANAWGNYYASRPRVITGDVRVANDLLCATPGLLELTRSLSGQIDDIVTRLGSLR